MERSSSSSDQVIKDVDCISKLPNDILLMILSRLSTEEAIRTSVVSKRWKHVWKHISHLIFNIPHMTDGLNRVDMLITKVINSHNGHLESCVIDHGVTGMLDTWIRLVTSVKHTKVLTLMSHCDCCYRTGKFFDFTPNSFSHPSLKSLSLRSYILRSSFPFSNCSNLRTLKLVLITASEVGVFNMVLASCPSLEVLVLDIACPNKSGGPLKIENNTLKVLHVSGMYYIDGIQVLATSLDILVIEDTTFGKDGFFLQSPKLQFNRNFWVNGRFVPHISYNISKEENSSIAHEELMNNISREFFRSIAIVSGSISVSVDLRNWIEVERLRQVLRLCPRKMMGGLEILFKHDNNNAATEDNNESWHKKFWKENNNKDAFPSAEFRVKTVWMNNFSGSEEEFAFASCLIKQRAVVDKMMIKTSLFPARKKLEIEAAVAKLRALQTKDQWELIIQCF